MVNILYIRKKVFVKFCSCFIILWTHFFALFQVPERMKHYEDERKPIPQIPVIHIVGGKLHSAPAEPPRGIFYCVLLRRHTQDTARKTSVPGKSLRTWRRILSCFEVDSGNILGLAATVSERSRCIPFCHKSSPESFAILLVQSTWHTVYRVHIISDKDYIVKKFFFLVPHRTAATVVLILWIALNPLSFLETGVAYVCRCGSFSAKLEMISRT